MLFHDYLVKLTIGSCQNVPATFSLPAFHLPVALEPVFSQQKWIQLAVLVKESGFSVSCLISAPPPLLNSVGLLWPQLWVLKLAWVREQEHGAKSSGGEWAGKWPFSFSNGKLLIWLKSCLEMAPWNAMR